MAYDLTKLNKEQFSNRIDYQNESYYIDDYIFSLDSFKQYVKDGMLDALEELKAFDVKPLEIEETKGMFIDVLKELENYDHSKHYIVTENAEILDYQVYEYLENDEV